VTRASCNPTQRGALPREPQDFPWHESCCSVQAGAVVHPCAPIEVLSEVWLEILTVQGGPQMPPSFTRTYFLEISTTFTRFKYHKSFQRIQELLDNKDSVTELLGELNDSVERKCVDYGDACTSSFAMYDILREAETSNGFKQDEVKYVLGVLGAAEFTAMVQSKCAFLDPFVTPRHGAETHRIQWWMIIQDMKKNPDKYDSDVDAGTLFAEALGESALLNNPGVGPDSTNNVWYHCLDANQGWCNTGRAPEALKAYFMSYPGIKAAEEGQMKWDTTVKMRFATWKDLGPAQRLMERNWEVRRSGVAT
jgi:hypothetical protein